MVKKRGRGSNRARMSLRNTIAVTMLPALGVAYGANEFIFGYDSVGALLTGTALGFCMHYLVIQFQRTFM